RRLVGGPHAPGELRAAGATHRHPPAARAASRVTGPGVCPRGLHTQPTFADVRSGAVLQFWESRPARAVRDGVVPHVRPARHVRVRLPATRVVRHEGLGHGIVAFVAFAGAGVAEVAEAPGATKRDTSECAAVDCTVPRPQLRTA